jgi:transcriptional regulator with XRE-family HTH domain
MPQTTTPKPRSLPKAERELRELLGENIRRARDEAELTQEQLAERLGVETGVISKWERGRRMPRADAFMAMAELFGHEHDLGWFYQEARDGGPE